MGTEMPSGIGSPQIALQTTLSVSFSGSGTLPTQTQSAMVATVTTANRTSFAAGKPSLTPPYAPGWEDGDASPQPICVLCRIVLGHGSQDKVEECLCAVRKPRTGAGKLVIRQVEDVAVLHGSHVLPPAREAISSAGLSPSP